MLGPRRAVRHARWIKFRIRVTYFVAVLILLYLTYTVATALAVKTKSETSTGIALSSPPTTTVVTTINEVNETNPNVPLPPTHQLFVQEISKQYGFDPNLIFAIMKIESDYNTKEYSSTHDIGIMQVNSTCYHAYYEYDPTPYKIYEADLKNRYDFKTNVITGINALRYWQDIVRKRGTGGRGHREEIKQILSHYNQGFKVSNHNYANKILKEVEHIAS